MKQDWSLGIKTIINELRRRIIWILLSAIVCGAALWGYSSFMVEPVYQANASIYVYNDTMRIEGIVTSQELTASQELAETYMVIIESNLVLEAVREEIDSARSISQLKSGISVSPINGTEVLSIAVKDTNPELAKKIANTIVDILPEELVRIVKAGSVEVIDYAKTPSAPISPDITRYTMVGVIFGLLFSCGICILTSAFFTKIRNEDDLVLYFEEPVLGSIPELKRRGGSNE